MKYKVGGSSYGQLSHLVSAVTSHKYAAIAPMEPTSLIPVAH